MGFCVVLMGCDTSEIIVTAPAAQPADPPVARVNGRPIEVATLERLLLQSHGRKVLDELILLEAVRQEAEKRNAHTATNMVEEELALFLQDMAPGQSPQRQADFLRYLLRARGLSRTQFDLILEKRALLRRLVDTDVGVSEEMIQDEYDREHGRKVTIRQLSLSTFTRLQQVQNLLDEGADFTELVSQWSEDQQTLTTGGLRGPFAAADENILPEFSRAAFMLEQIGQISDVITHHDDTGTHWWTLARLEQITPPDNLPLTDVRDQLVASLRQKIIAQRMADLQSAIQSNTRSIILHPLLRKESN